MGLYTRRIFTTADALTADALNDELEKIETAVNAIEDANVAGLSTSALNNPRAYYTLQFRKDSLGAGELITTVQDLVPIPANSALVRVAAICTARSGTPSPYIDVYLDSGSSILASPITLANANTVYTASSIVTDVTTSNYLTLRCWTASSGGGITNLRVCVLLKALHIS